MFWTWLANNSIQIISVLVGIFIVWKQYKLEKRLTEESYLNNSRTEVTTSIALKKIKIGEDMQNKLYSLKKWLQILPGFVNVDSRSTLLLNAQESIDDIKTVLEVNSGLFNSFYLECYEYCVKFERYLSAIDTNEIDKPFLDDVSYLDGEIVDNNPQKIKLERIPLWQRLDVELEADYMVLTSTLSAEMNELNLNK